MIALLSWGDMQKRRSTLLFNIVFASFLFFIISIVQFYLFKSSANKGISGDDWLVLFIYKYLGENFIYSAFNAWTIYGPHYAAQILYIGVLRDLFGFNYNAWFSSGIFLKILASLSIYPLIMIILKNRWLAFFSTLFYSISYASTGSLTYIVTGVEYISIIFMNIFFICFYLMVRNNYIFKYTFYSTIAFFLTLFASPIRQYPLFIIIGLLCLYLCIFNKNTSKLKLFKHTFLIILPGILLFIMGNKELNVEYPENIFKNIKLIMQGNWHFLLSPISGLGAIILPWSSLSIFGYINSASFFDFIDFLISKTLIIFFSASLLLSLILSRKNTRFFFTLVLVNFLLEIIVFIVLNHRLGLEQGAVVDFSINIQYRILYSVILAIFILSISFVTFFEWFISGKTNKYLLVIAASPIFSFIFIISTWILLQYNEVLVDGINRYFVVATVGISIFEGSLLFMIKEKFKNIRILSSIIMILIAICFYYFINVSRNEISQTFNSLSTWGNDKNSQILVQNWILRFIPTQNEDLLVFIQKVDDSDQTKITTQAIYESYVPGNFAHWLFVRRNNLRGDGKIKGCIGIVTDLNELKKSKIKDGFFFKSFCVTEMQNLKTLDPLQLQEHNFSFGDFFAFSVDNGAVRETTKDILSNL